MNKIYAIARWEYLEKVKKKSFIASLLLTPLFLLGSFLIPAYFSDKEGDKQKVFVIIDETEIVKPILNSKLSEKYKLESKMPFYKILELDEFGNNFPVQKSIAINKVLNEEIDGYIFIPRNALSSHKVKIEFGSKNIFILQDQERLKNEVEEILFTFQLEKKGYNYAEVTKLKPNIDLNAIKITSEEDSNNQGPLQVFFSGYLLNIMLLILVFTTGQMMVRSLVEEKSNKLVEVLLSSCSSKELLSGKIIGLSLLGLSIIIFWIILFLLASIVSTQSIVSFETVNLFLSSLFLISGYFLYSSFFIAIGSLTSSEQDAQQITGYLSFIFVVPLLLLVPVMQTPNALFVKILSFIPLFTPSIMIMRINFQTPSYLEILMSLLVLIISGYYMTIIAGKIFRIGILLTGKRPTFKQVYTWLKNKE
ncbi:MAG: ABC transporter permease [Bacteroidetes bacterium]|nr:ABC transporter permease [Bacteroidota bacterium]